MSRCLLPAFGCAMPGQVGGIALALQSRRCMRTGRIEARVSGKGGLYARGGSIAWLCALKKLRNRGELLRVNMAKNVTAAAIFRRSMPAGDRFFDRLPELD